MVKKITLEDLAVITKKGFDEAGRRFEKIDRRFEKIDGRFEKIDGRLSKIESTMVTKDYLDDKLADLRGDLVVLVRKEDNKLIKLVEILQVKNVLVDKEVKEILRIEPFAKLV